MDTFIRRQVKNPDIDLNLLRGTVCSEKPAPLPSPQETTGCSLENETKEARQYQGWGTIVKMGIKGNPIYWQVRPFPSSFRRWFSGITALHSLTEDDESSLESREKNLPILTFWGLSVK